MDPKHYRAVREGQVNVLLQNKDQFGVPTDPKQEQCPPYRSLVNLVIRRVYTKFLEIVHGFYFKLMRVARLPYTFQQEKDTTG